MEIEEKEELDSRKYNLKEFQFFDGECDITLNIVDINFNRKTITVTKLNFSETA